MFIFSFLIGFGASIALLRLALATRAEERLRDLFLGLVVLATALTGSRLAFVWLHLSYYSSRTNEIPALHQGGFWWPGALAGGLLAILVIALTRRSSRGRALDAFSTMLLPLAAAFWLASWSAGVAYGQRLDPAIWWGLPMLDLAGVIANRVPVQPAAAVSLLVLLGGTEWLLKPKLKPGQQLPIQLLLLSLHTLVFTFMRDDPMQIWHGLRLDGLASLIFILLATFWLAAFFAVQSKKVKLTEEVEGDH